MNMLKNKKGFTLIEMLVVIAIIAVLVAIIIPVVGSSTTKAQAATDAANLRSVLAEATTDYLAGTDNNAGLVKVSHVSNAIKLEPVSATNPKCKSLEGATLYIGVNSSDKSIVVAFMKDSKYYTINDFATVAESGGTLAPTGSAAS